MNVPDYISPVIGHRVWRWDLAGLKSLNGERWHPGQAMTARCRASNQHQPPQESCSCGIYSARSLDQLRWRGYAAFAISGEVHLWGTIVEHELGWRAQFAYPKNLVVPFEMIPVDVKEAQSHLRALVAYGVDIFIDDGEEQIPVWKKGTGYESAGLDYLRRVASGQVQVTVPIAVLKEDPRRHILLQNGRAVKHSAKIAFTNVRFAVHAHPITSRLKSPHFMAVVFDLRPGNARLTNHAISIIRMASTFRTGNSNVAIFIRQDRNKPVSITPGHLWADEYLNCDGYDVQRAFERFFKRRAQQRRAYGSCPPRGGRPGGPPPPPAVLVLSPRNWPRLPLPRKVAWAI
jgi:hypothetical protein